MGPTAEGFFASVINQGLPCEIHDRPSTIHDMLIPRETALFSMHLTPKAVGNAELTIGGIDHTKFKGTKESRYSLLILEANELRRQTRLCVLTRGQPQLATHVA